MRSHFRIKNWSSRYGNNFRTNAFVDENDGNRTRGLLKLDSGRRLLKVSASRQIEMRQGEWKFPVATCSQQVRKAPIAIYILYIKTLLLFLFIMYYLLYLISRQNFYKRRIQNDNFLEVCQ